MISLYRSWQKNSNILYEYRKAFVKFTDASADEFFISNEYDVLAHYEGKTYAIYHYDDLLSLFKTYFSSDFTLIYTEVPMGLWELLFDKHSEISYQLCLLYI
jgi:hypothetical protein